MFRHIHILLVEDDAVEAEHLVRSFRQQQFTGQVICTHNAHEAWQRLCGDANRPPLPHPYLILLDMRLPGMSGLEFLQTLRQDPQLKASIVFLLSTLASEREVQQAYNLGVAGFIMKDKAGPAYEPLIRLLEGYFTLVSPFNHYLFENS